MCYVKARNEKRMKLDKKMKFTPTEKNKERLAKMNNINHINSESH